LEGHTDSYEYVVVSLDHIRDKKRCEDIIERKKQVDRRISMSIILGIDNDRVRS
jgi:hypothetical protein